jgi:hypothetical protein
MESKQGECVSGPIDFPGYLPETTLIMDFSASHLLYKEEDKPDI